MIGKQNVINQQKDELLKRQRKKANCKAETIAPTSITSSVEKASDDRQTAFLLLNEKLKEQVIKQEKLIAYKRLKNKEYKDRLKNKSFYDKVEFEMRIEECISEYLDKPMAYGKLSKISFTERLQNKRLREFLIDIEYDNRASVLEAAIKEYEKIYMSVIDCVAETIISKENTQRMQKQNIRTSTVANQFLKLSVADIDSLVSKCIQPKKTPINNMRSYLMTMLYDAVGTGEIYYKSLAIAK